MFKNQLQELAQRSCFNLPSYACIREGPDHAPRFKASVNFNGEVFESPSYCTTLRQAEHAAAEVALNALSASGPSRSLTARVLDETGVYKNLLQETAHRAGRDLPVYTTVRSGPGHLPVFSSTVELAGMNFAGEPAKTKKQAEKNAAIAAWSTLKKMPNLNSLSQTSREADNGEGHDQVPVARAFSSIGARHESRTIRKSYQNHPRRRLLRNCRDNSSNNINTEQQEWRHMDLFADPTKEGSTQKQNCFVSLLPPPPPRTMSKILPPTLPPLRLSKTKPPPPTITNAADSTSRNSLAKMHRDEEEWFNGKTEAVKKPLEEEDRSQSSSSVIQNANNIIHHRPYSGKLQVSLFDQSAAAQMTVSTAKVSTFTRSQMGMSRSSYFGFGGGYHPQRIAPAVQIRSVIPVCAAPPSAAIKPSTSTPALLVKERIATAASSLPRRAAAEVASSGGLKSKTLEGSSPKTQVNSKFSELRL